MTSETSQHGNAVAVKHVDFHYNPASEWTTIQRYADLDGYLAVATGTYTYDDGRITGLSYTLANNSSSPAYTWTWDDGNRITQFTSALDAATGYSYGTATYTNDPTGQLTDAVYSNWQYAPGTEDYGYDDNGNRITNGFEVGDHRDNQMTSNGTFHYEYDAEGNRSMRYIWTDANSNGEADPGERSQITEYTWDQRNRLVSVIDRPSEGANSTQEVTYQYDYQNRLVRKNLDPDGASGYATMHQTAFVYDGIETLMQFEKDGTGDIATSGLSHRYLYGAAVDQVLADEVVDNGAAEDVLWTLGDYLNSVRDLAVYNSGNNTTTAVNHRVFDAFGRLTSETDPTTGNPATVHSFMAFTGKPFDKDIGEQYNINRWYEPATGKWLSVDPEAADVNLYRYVGNNPNAWFDPTGLDWTDWFASPNSIAAKKIRQAPPGTYFSNPWSNFGGVSSQWVGSSFFVEDVTPAKTTTADVVHSKDAAGRCWARTYMVTTTHYYGHLVHYEQDFQKQRRLSSRAASLTEFAIKLQMIITLAQQDKITCEYDAANYTLQATTYGALARKDPRFYILVLELGAAAAAKKYLAIELGEMIGEWQKQLTAANATLAAMTDFEQYEEREIAVGQRVLRRSLLHPEQIETRDASVERTFVTSERCDPYCTKSK
jgi:RHS repeat-associated protein